MKFDKQWEYGLREVWFFVERKTWLKTYPGRYVFVRKAHSTEGHEPLNSMLALVMQMDDSTRPVVELLTYKGDHQYQYEATVLTFPTIEGLIQFKLSLP